MTIAVGTDGTDCSMAAVEWAAIEVQRRRTPLRVVHAFHWDWQESRFDIGTEYFDVDRHLAEALVVEAGNRARECGPDIDMTIDTLIGHATPRLLEAARRAEPLVLGSRDRGGFAGLLLGTVGMQLLHHAASPVLIVRSEAAR
jgi:nucleotide-binding universal stress UspA family protein